jgi:hypothetical protein
MINTGVGEMVVPNNKPGLAAILVYGCQSSIIETLIFKGVILYEQIVPGSSRTCAPRYSSLEILYNPSGVTITSNKLVVVNDTIHKSIYPSNITNRDNVRTACCWSKSIIVEAQIR